MRVVGDRTINTPKTSVIIPVYNTQDYLPACLDSVLAQTQKEIEVILVDDGSTDGSLGIELDYASRDPRVRVVQQQNLRQGTARNRGLAEARGEYVYFMDSDDLLAPEHFETCYRVCKEYELDFVTFETTGFLNDPSIEQLELFTEICDRRGKITEDVVDGCTFWTRYFPYGLVSFLCWLEYFDRSFLLDNDLRFVEGIYFEDNDWIARVFMAAKRIKYLPLKLHYYRSRPGSNVHSGFTHVLADSCFDVHAILCGLARCEQDPVRLKIIENVSDVKDCRFRQFALLEPTEYLSEMILAFVSLLLDECSRDDLPDIIRSMHFSAVTSIAEGIAAWPHPPFVCTKELTDKLMRLDLLPINSSTRIGIYGTGASCEGFLLAFDLLERSYFFLETDAAPGREFKGKPVTDIKDAGALNLDLIVIASEKYASEMKANATRYLGESMPIYVVPHGSSALRRIWLSG